MNKIVLSIFLVANLSMAKAPLNQDDITPSMHVKALVQASGGGVDIWVDALKKCALHPEAKIKTAVASIPAMLEVFAGKAAMRFREQIEKDTTIVDGDVMMATLSVTGNEDTVTVESDIHRIEVFYAKNGEQLQEGEKAVADADEMEGTYTNKDDCTECIHKWKNVFVHSENKILHHDKATCKSVFPKQQFLDDLKEAN